MKSDLKSKIFILLILILIISINIVFFHQTPYSGVYNNDQKDDYPKLNAPDITIITPENKTYTEPMSGYYPATYGFENDISGGYPSMWEIDDAAGAVRIIEELDGHKKVLELQTESITADVVVNQTFETQTFGTLELWWRMNDTSKRSSLGFVNSLTHLGAITLLWRGDFNDWQYNDAGVWKTVPNIPSPIQNSWYRMIIHFERTTGNYQGLSQNKWKVIFNGIDSGELNFRNNQDIGKLKIFTYPHEYSFYIDAIGYSWDPTYNLGDNIFEGLLLSFQNDTALDWMGYSFDGQTNNTILGNSTISFPEDGLHTIQVFGNDSMGAIHESDVRYFTIDTVPPEISITYPTTGQEFSNPPSFILSIIEENVVSSWYTLNGGSNIPFTGDSGVIDSTAWNALPDGPVTIRFYIRDSADREDFEEVTIVKVPGQEGSPKIPGYNLYIIIGIISIVIIGLINRRIKN